MPEINASSIRGVYLGDHLAGALMYGTNEIYVHSTIHAIYTPGDFSYTMPEWASAYGVVLSGGGGGGRAGSGADNSNGHGGQGGDVLAIWGRLIGDKNRVLSGTIGAGGAGGASGSAYGENGGTTTFISHASNVYSAAGGVAKPTSGMRNGGIGKTKLEDPFHKYFNMPLDWEYKNGPGGTGNGGSGTLGGGGAGGEGGFFNNYTRGGKGGDGFVIIYVWGYPRH